MSGFFVSFEGTEGSGKSTQVTLLAERLTGLGYKYRMLREPGGTPIGEEIRHTLKHSNVNHSMTPETELLLMNASRAQLVREIIRPALQRGEIIISDRFFDSTTAYQSFGRGLDPALVRQIIRCAVGDTRPDLTLLLAIPVELSEARRLGRLLPGLENLRDRMEEADRSFFQRVEEGYRYVAAAEPDRVKTIDASQSPAEVSQAIWRVMEPVLLKRRLQPGG
jgi:dTMP kinase